MRKIVLLALFSLFLLTGQSQNIQLHYDMGKDRGYTTTTVEMFKPDKWGTTFFFIDMDYGVTENLEGVNLAYFEFARTINLGKETPFGFHAEYDGGLFQVNKNITVNIENAWLAGVDYTTTAKDFSKGISLKALYKNIQGKHDMAWQFTAVWYYHFFDKKATFMGFFDYWREDRDLNSDGDKARYVLLTEP
ncbi:MAG: DUF5020 family protein, partial [Bacteroidales bacterium]|nr:DUF5020 family protein [Bacteroidales bacterium]